MNKTISEDKKIRLPDQNINDIMGYIPHRHPFLLIDKVVDIIAYEQATGIKCVTYNEPFFTGHFPHQPIMPGVMIVEAMAQTSAILIGSSMNLRAADKLVYFLSMDKGRFRKPVVPGDYLKLHVTPLHSRSTIWSFVGKAKVDGELVAECTFKAALMDNKE